MIGWKRRTPQAATVTSLVITRVQQRTGTATVGRVPFVALEPLLVYLPRALRIPRPDSCKTVLILAKRTMQRVLSESNCFKQKKTCE